MTNSDTELLPCPFCLKSSAEPNEYPNYGWCMECTWCGATSGYHRDIDDTYKAWNTRANLPTHGGDVERTNIYNRGYIDGWNDCLEAEGKPQAAQLPNLHELVVILPEGAEPEVGDWILIKGNPDYDDYEFSIVQLNAIWWNDPDNMLDVETSDCDFNRGYFFKYFVKIIQRNGKPVVYMPTDNKGE